MKFSSYGPQVAVSSSAPAKQSSPRYVAEGGNGAYAMGKAFNQLAAVAQKAQDERDASDYMAADNEITTRILTGLYGDGKENRGILNLRGEEAKDMVDKAQAFMNSTREDVLKNYNGRVRSAYERNRKENFYNYMRVAASKQAQEQEATLKSNFNASLDSAINVACQNPTDAGTLKLSLADLKNIGNAYGHHMNYNPAQMLGLNRENMDKFSRPYITTLVDNGYIDQAASFLKDHKTEIGIDTYNQLNKVVQQKTVKVENKGMAKDFWAQSGGNLTKALELVENAGTWTKGPGGAGFSGEYGTADIPMQGGPDGHIAEEVSNLAGKWSNVIPQLGGLFKNKFGVDAEISSAARSPEDNANANGSETSWHKSADALDIVFDDDTPQEKIDEMVQYFKDSGKFDEVLYHDYGSGYHLHLGGLQESGEDSEDKGTFVPLDEDRKDAIRQQLRAMVADAKREESETNKAAKEAGRDAVMAAGSQEEAEDILQSYRDAGDYYGAEGAMSAFSAKGYKRSSGSGGKSSYSDESDEGGYVENFGDTKQGAAVLKELNHISYKLYLDDKFSVTDIEKFKAAGSAMAANGLSPEEQADYASVVDDTDVMATLTDLLDDETKEEPFTIGDAYNYLRHAGLSNNAALCVISTFDAKYFRN